MKPKKLLLLLTFSLLCVSVKAQTLTFDETVKFINDKIKCCADGWGEEQVITSEKNGILIVANVNPEFPNEVAILKLTNYLKMPEKPESYITYYGIGANIYTDFRGAKIDGKEIFEVNVGDRSVLNKIGIGFTSRTLAIKVAKAFAHLQTLSVAQLTSFNN